VIIYIKKENDKLKIITPSQKKIINFNDWFFINKDFFNYYNELKEKLKPFFKEEKEMDFKNKKLTTYYYEFDLQKKKIVDKIIKEEKKELEKINKELKELFKKSIFENDISVETKFFFFNEAINDEELKQAKKVAFDLEIWSDKVPNPNKDPIVLASFYGDNIAKVLVYDNEDKVNLDIVKKINEEKGFNYEIEFVKSEKEMIIKIIETLKQFDIIFSYNGDNFDFYFLKEKAKLLGLDEIAKEIEIKGVKEKRATLKEKLHIDLFVFIKNLMANTLQSELLNLDSVSKEVLGEQKEGSWKFIKDINYLIPYNFKDSYLTFKLAMHYFPIMVQLAKAVNQPLFKVTRATYGKLVEYKLMKESKRFNQLIPQEPSFKEVQEREQITYKGGFVYDVKFGIYNNIAVLDFQSLYPSIIVTFNICPSTYDGFIELTKEEYKKLKENLEINDLETETHYLTPPIEFQGKYLRFKFKKDKKGFIPSIIEELLNKRIKIKKLYKEKKKEFEKIKDKLSKEELQKLKEEIDFLYAEQYSLKILINAMYGYLGYSRARWFFLEGAMSITAFGRFFIKKIISFAEKQGFKVIYGDTDSLFIVFNKKEELNSFLEYVNNKILPGIMKLDLEDFYKRGIFVPAKGEERGAKKKYALINENNEIKIRGFETVRRDWSILAKEVQNKVIELILNNKIEEAKNYVKKIVEQLKNKTIPKDKLIIYTQLRKELNEYESEGPHVKLAKKLAEKGYNIGKGSIIAYIVGKGSGNIKDRVYLPEEAKDYDENYYINNQIIPAVERIFEVLGINIKEEVQGKKQVNIFSFLRK
jgi:DNA polymerase elongation subunit (family B)